MSTIHVICTGYKMSVIVAAWDSHLPHGSPFTALFLEHWYFIFQSDRLVQKKTITLLLAHWGFIVFVLAYQNLVISWPLCWDGLSTLYKDAVLLAKSYLYTCSRNLVPAAFIFKEGPVVYVTQPGFVQQQGSPSGAHKASSEEVLGLLWQ